MLREPVGDPERDFVERPDALTEAVTLTEPVVLPEPELLGETVTERDASGDMVTVPRGV